MSRVSRRKFLQTTLAAAATVTIGGTKSSGRVMGANDRVRIAVAGLNVLAFYSTTFHRLLARAADAAPPLGARIAGSVSLCAWIGVLAAGRLLTFFRP